MLKTWRQQKLSTAIPAQFERLKDIPRRVAGFISAVVKRLPNRERGEIHQNIGAMRENSQGYRICFRIETWVASTTASCGVAGPPARGYALS